MTKLKYILKSFFHYLKANILVAVGVAVSTTVLTGSLIIGDSVQYSLKQAAFSRLGATTHLVGVTERYFRQEMAGELEGVHQEISAAPVLLLDGVAVARGGQQRVNQVQVIGVDRCFEKIARSEVYSELQENEIAVSRNMAERLQVSPGDPLLVRIRKASLIPMNAPFVSAEETSVSLRATIQKVVGKEELGRFNLKNSQTAPYNLFLSLETLNRLMTFRGKANHLLVSTPLRTEEVKKAVDQCLKPSDAGLSVEQVPTTGETEISTERFFMESPVAQTLEKLPGAQPLITYFADGIALPAAGAETPYSFVSSLGQGQLEDHEIVLTQWTADDLGAAPGDSIILKYKETGPLRRLTDKTAQGTCLFIL